MLTHLLRKNRSYEKLKTANIYFPLQVQNLCTILCFYILTIYYLYALSYFASINHGIIQAFGILISWGETS